MASYLTAEVALQKVAKAHPLVKGDEKIAVFGAGGQIGAKLIPVLNKYYGKNVLFYDVRENPEKDIHALDVTDLDTVEKTIQKNNVKVVINLAALLSAAAEKNSKLAETINLKVPLVMMDKAKEWGLRKLMIPSSIAAVEIHENALSRALHLKEDVPSENFSPARRGLYGKHKVALENHANELMEKFTGKGSTEIYILRLAGVLNCQTPWPAEGTTEELDKLIVACAEHAVLGIEEAPHSKNGPYVPQVPAETTFAMIDGNTLAETMLLLLHQPLSKDVGAVHNLYEYSANMGETAEILKSLNPNFLVKFLDAPGDGVISTTDDTEDNNRERLRKADLGDLDAGKLSRSKKWPISLAPSPLLNGFKPCDVEKSITESYRRAVKEFQALEQPLVKNSPANVAVKKI